MEGLFAGNQLLLASAEHFKQFLADAVAQLREELQKEKNPQEWLSVAEIAEEFKMSPENALKIIKKILSHDPETDAIIDLALNDAESSGRSSYRIKRGKMEEFGRQFQKKSWNKSKGGLKAA